MAMPLDAQSAREAPAEAGAPEEDDALMARFAAGDRRAAQLLTERLAPRALAVAMRMLADRHEAEDVTQEAFLRLWRQAPSWRAGQAAPGTWLHRVVANLCIDRLRRRARMSDAPPPDREDEGPSALERISARQEAARLRAEIDALPDRQRAALTMRHFAEMSNPEIAERLGVSVEAVESLLARARRRLAQRLAAPAGGARAPADERRRP
ncbi:sigma-70 family RNA polymerase sigma factor [Oceanicella actignis]